MTKDELLKEFISGRVSVSQEEINKEPLRNMLPKTPPSSPPATEDQKKKSGK